MPELDPPEPLPATAPPPPQQLDSLPPAPADSSLGKRHRRPSVRLGEIGDQTQVLLSFESNPTRTKNSRLPTKSSKTRPLTVLNGDSHETLDAGDRNFSADGLSNFRSRKFWTKKGTLRRARINWSESPPLKDPSPVHPIDQDTLNFWTRRPARASDNDLENMPEADSGDRKCDSSTDGVRDWLIGLGLGRYAPVFEIHEVDDEVLQLLRLDDLKDMGINAVGSRRKMYTAIQKLRKGFY